MLPGTEVILSLKNGTQRIMAGATCCVSGPRKPSPKSNTRGKPRHEFALLGPVFQFDYAHMFKNIFGGLL